MDELPIIFIYYVSLNGKIFNSRTVRSYIHPVLSYIHTVLSYIHHILSYVHSASHIFIPFSHILTLFFHIFIICEASLQSPQNVARNEMVEIVDYNLISLIKLQ